MQSSAIINGTWTQGVYDAILKVAKAEVGIARIHVSRKEVMKQGTEQVDRIEIILSVRAP